MLSVAGKSNFEVNPSEHFTEQQSARQISSPFISLHVISKNSRVAHRVPSLALSKN